MKIAKTSITSKQASTLREGLLSYQRKFRSIDHTNTKIMLRKIKPDEDKEYVFGQGEITLLTKMLEDFSQSCHDRAEEKKSWITHLEKLQTQMVNERLSRDPFATRNLFVRAVNKAAFRKSPPPSEEELANNTRLEKARQERLELLGHASTSCTILPKLVQAERKILSEEALSA